MIPTLIALLFLAQTGDTIWNTYNCPVGDCTFIIRNGTASIDTAKEPRWNDIPVICMTGPYNDREFFQPCQAFNMDDDDDFDLRDFANLQRAMR